MEAETAIPGQHPVQVGVVQAQAKPEDETTHLGGAAACFCSF